MRLRNIEDKNKEQLKTIEDQEEVQAKAISKNKIKPTLLNSIYSQEVKDGRIDNSEAKKIFKILEDMEGSKINYSKLVYREGGNVYFDFTRSGPLSSFYLKLINGNIGISVAKWNMEEFRDEIKRQENKRAKKKPYKINKKQVLENAKALYDWLGIIVNAFERGVFEYGGRPQLDIDYDSGTYDLTGKELQMFNKLFKYDNPDKLWNALMDADKEKYDELLSDLKIKQIVLEEQIDIKTGTERRTLEKLADTVKDNLVSVREKRDMHDSKIPDLEGEESPAQRRNQPGRGLKILIPDEMLNRLL